MVVTIEVIAIVKHDTTTFIALKCCKLHVT